MITEKIEDVDCIDKDDDLNHYCSFEVGEILKVGEPGPSLCSLILKLKTKCDESYKVGKSPKDCPECVKEAFRIWQRK